MDTSPAPTASEPITNLRSLFDAARPKQFTASFTSRGGITFSCTLKACNKRDLDAYGRSAFKKEWDKQAKSWDRIPDDAAYRAFCAQAVLGWSDLTVTKAFELARAVPATDLNGDGQRPVAWSGDAALLLCETVVGFADWVFGQVVETSAQVEAHEAEVKNG